MVDETKIPDMNEEQCLDILRTHSPTNPTWEAARAMLQIKSASRMVASSRRIESATYLILAVTVVQLALLVVPCFRHF